LEKTNSDRNGTFGGMENASREKPDASFLSILLYTCCLFRSKVRGPDPSGHLLLTPLPSGFQWRTSLHGVMGHNNDHRLCSPAGSVARFQQHTRLVLSGCSIVPQQENIEMQSSRGCGSTRLLAHLLQHFLFHFLQRGLLSSRSSVVVRVMPSEFESARGQGDRDQPPSEENREYQGQRSDIHRPSPT
jgi:hypothetical protein